MQQIACCRCVASFDSCLSGGKAIDLLGSKWNGRSGRKRNGHQRAGDCGDQVGDSFAIQRTNGMRLADFRLRIGESLDQLQTFGRCNQVDLVDDVDSSHVWCKLWRLEFGFGIDDSSRSFAAS